MRANDSVSELGIMVTRVDALARIAPGAEIIVRTTDYGSKSGTTGMGERMSANDSVRMITV